jgi:predicted nucleotidyltransferase component of viral defense system
MQLRRHVAFDRFLTRLFQISGSNLIVKGGYALELSIDYARTTKDIDISFKGNLGGLWKGKEKSDPEDLQEFIQKRVSADVGDFFEFEIGSKVKELENAPYGGYRFPVNAIMAGRRFIKFEIDIGGGDVWMEPHENVQLKNWFQFAGLESQKISIISKEQQFAEKLHAYTLPRETPNSRVKDLVDLLILSRAKTINKEILLTAVRATFSKRKTHELISKLPNPPTNWEQPFHNLCDMCDEKTLSLLKNGSFRCYPPVF